MTQTSKKQTITPLPWATPQIICVELTGTVKRQDHIDHIREPIAKSIKDAGWFSLLLYYAPEFKGWEADAADSSFRSIIDFGQKAKKLGYVNPPNKKVLQMKLSKALFSGEIRFFNADDLDKARQWIMEEEKAAPDAPSSPDQGLTGQ